jgi:F0F1-type ATP synthase membrane subunit b/b'
MEYIYLLIAFIIIVSIASYILWKKTPPAPETYQKLAEELYDEVCKLNNEIQKKDKEIQRLNNNFRIVKAKAVEIRDQNRG